MAKLSVSLRDVDSRRVGGCQKPKCPASGILHRHHKKHEAMWFGIWSGRRRTEPKWQAFVKRYYEFRQEDYVIICPSHHAEIHTIYDLLIKEDKQSVGRPLSKYSWRQAELLMSKLEDACMLWLRTRTPGVDSDTFRQKRDAKNKSGNRTVSPDGKR